MKLSELIEGLGLQLIRGDAQCAVTDLTDDSRLVKRGALFIARSGTKSDGSKFIADALSKGAAAVLIEGDAPPAIALSEKVTLLSAAKIDHAFVSRLAERFFGEPGKKLQLIAVTGTNGKTTITFIVQHLLQNAGVKTGVIGTVLIDNGATRTAAELTTPGGIEFSRHLAAMVENGCRAAIAEVSSHALHQGRVGSLDFAVAIFTNLTGDHLDYHGTMEEYAAAKAMLFENLKPSAWAVVNRDDAWAGRMLRNCRARVVECRVIKSDTEGRAVSPLASDTQGASSAIASTATILHLGASHSRVQFDGPWGGVEVDLPLVGRHNVINALEAMAAANCVASIAKGLHDTLEKCPAPPGRLEPVRPSAGDASTLPTVLVDYAHTHDALENVLSALRPVTPGKLIAVFGCGGDRDRTKRPKMAAVCCRLADHVIVTSDNPRTEDPAFIIGQVLTGVPAALRPAGVRTFEVEGVDPAEIVAMSRRAPESKNGGLEVEVEPDRAAAIARAIRSASPRDTVLIAGKGHEDYQIIGTTKRHFDDREEAARALRARS
ncbi:MAG: UDP-N-acetylmuramoyl-L-alanyl-D-glutamate--2,6-diaminopimelate ligase [Phycisphaeraceae bacterium]|nr:UDP-N-acetylmuramoyl-L-alanyl-D-glutamate--2,6-diaminopimelate ligase [Phycisphaeraceae bacterium]